MEPHQSRNIMKVEAYVAVWISVCVYVCVSCRYAAVQALVTRSTVGWPAAADQALAAATGRVREGVMGVLQERLGRFPSALRVARTTAHALVTEMATEAERQVRDAEHVACLALMTNIVPWHTTGYSGTV